MYGPASCVEDKDGYYDDDRDEGPIIMEPKPGPKAIELWAVNSVCYFVYQLACWAAAEAHAQKERDMWRRFDELDELLAKADAEIAKHD